MKLKQTHYFLLLHYLSITSCIAKLPLIQICKFYCFHPGPHRCYKYAQHNRLPNNGKSISRNVVSLNIPVHDVINLLYYKQNKTNKNIFTYIRETPPKSEEKEERKTER